jgi:hypothetical protein
MSAGSIQGEHRGGRKKGSRNKVTKGARDYFASIFTEEMENQGWDKFLNHENPQIAFEAFKRAVEYKRGKPISRTELTGSKNAEAPAIRVLIEHVGSPRPTPAQAGDTP